jgi:Ran GTPase-activating protein (RanGAP) involved in mRNA processing and transport
MSANFRPVIEKWGPSSDCFIKSDGVEEVLTSLSLASFPGGTLEINEYDEVNVVWIEDGKKFLDYIDSKSVDQLISESSEIAERDDLDDVRILLESIKRLSSEWRQLVDDSDGSLRFYIDQY